MEPIQVSISGGRSSAMMARLMQENYPAEQLIYTFANTGRELPETIDFVRSCADVWGMDINLIEYIDNEAGFELKSWDNLSMSGEPFERLIEKRKYLPNTVTRFCTQELKVRPMKKYMLSLGFKNWITALGIRADEQRRYRKLKNNSGKDRWEYCFPLVSMNIKKQQVYDFFKNQSFDLGIPSEHGNCDFCFLKNINKRLSLYRKHPERLEWWAKMEANFGGTFNKDYPASFIAELSKIPKLFNDIEYECFCGE